MNTRTESLTQASAPAATHDGSYADWSAILAGSVVAAGLASVFSTFGAALGLAIISPYEGEGSAIAAAIAVGSWMIWTVVSSLMAGGYVAGRLRRRIDVASADEVSVRDGIHGLAVWGVAILLGAWVAGAATDTAVNAAADTAAAVVAQDAGAASSTGVATTTVGATATQPSEAEMKAVAQTAKNYSVIAAFVTAASLLIAAAGAYWAAGTGGRHRDENRAFSRFGRWT